MKKTYTDNDLINLVSYSETFYNIARDMGARKKMKYQVCSWVNHVIEKMRSENRFISESEERYYGFHLRQIAFLNRNKLEFKL